MRPHWTLGTLQPEALRDMNATPASVENKWPTYVDIKGLGTVCVLPDSWELHTQRPTRNPGRRREQAWVRAVSLWKDNFLPLRKWSKPRAWAQRGQGLHGLACQFPPPQ